MNKKYVFPDSDLADIEDKYQRGEINSSQKEELLEQLQRDINNAYGESQNF